MKYKWTLVHHVPNGHRFFKDEISGKIAVADRSGVTPDKTEDGVLWIDTSRPVSVSVRAQFSPISVPVLGERSSGQFVGNGFDGAETFLPFLKNCGFTLEIAQPGLVKLLASFLGE